MTGKPIRVLLVVIAILIANVLRFAHQRSVVRVRGVASETGDAK
jgi:hypothetical protein